MKLVFFEKPGCTNNTRQKQWLREQGIAVEAIDLLSHRWSEEELLAFFGTLPVADWFNRSAPRVKSGEIVPEKLTRQEALQALLDEPLLIRRPLMHMESAHHVGFDIASVTSWLGISGADELPKIDEPCPHPARPCIVEDETK